MDQPLRLDPLRHFTNAVQISPRPPPRIRLDRNPVRPERIKLCHLSVHFERSRETSLPRSPDKQLHECIAVQQQVRSHRLHQPLPARLRRDQPRHFRLGTHDRCRSDAFRHQPHRPLRDRIQRVGVAHLRFIGSRPLARGERHAEPARQRRPRAPAPGLLPEPFHADPFGRAEAARPIRPTHISSACPVSARSSSRCQAFCADLVKPHAPVLARKTPPRARSARSNDGCETVRGAQGRCRAGTRRRGSRRASPDGR